MNNIWLDSSLTTSFPFSSCTCLLSLGSFDFSRRSGRRPRRMMSRHTYRTQTDTHKHKGPHCRRLPALCYCDPSKASKNGVYDRHCLLLLSVAEFGFERRRADRSTHNSVGRFHRPATARPSFAIAGVRLALQLSRFLGRRTFPRSVSLSLSLLLIVQLSWSLRGPPLSISRSLSEPHTHRGHIGGCIFPFGFPLGLVSTMRYLPRLDGWRFQAREAVGWTCGRKCNGGAARPAAGNAHKSDGRPRTCRSWWFAAPRALLPIRLTRRPPCPSLRAVGSIRDGGPKKKKRIQQTTKWNTARRQQTVGGVVYGRF